MYYRGVVLGVVFSLAVGVNAWAKAPVWSAPDLDSLLGPIALYPDPLLAQMLPAATAPDDLALAVRYLEDGGELGQVDGQPWTDNAKALARWPEVLRMMNRSRDWTDAVGAAFLDQPKDVLASIQRLRGAAWASGALQTTNEQRVVAQKGSICVYPADPSAIHLPQYDPNAVYILPTSSGGVGRVSFGSVLLVGYWLNYELDWRKRRVYSYDYREYPYGRRNPWYFGGEVAGEAPPNLPKQRNGEWKPDRKRARPHVKPGEPLPMIQNLSEPVEQPQKDEPAKAITESRPLAAPKDLVPPPPMLTPVDPEMEPVEELPAAKAPRAGTGAKKPAGGKTVPAAAVKTKPAEATAVPAKPVKAKPAATKTAPVKPVKAKPAAVKAAPAKPVKEKATATKPAPAATGKAKPSAAKPAAAKPVKAEPAVKKPVPAKSVKAKPSETKPSSKKQP
jgi:hypothetical protein